ncbi:MAG: inorganic diphosphatase [Candidatus Nomurabacteria bacterium]|jgi:inorganic pyrophosphatase|nr:inorganic diphosphatase [Candidatus Nomurabacteria bacterium]
MGQISYGEDAPNTVNLIIEIKRGEGRNKYEMDKETGYITLDRVNGTMLGYPADYGYVPGTLCEDGDPLDGLLVIDESVPQNVVVPVRPIGVLYMVDDGENDEKLICVPADDISKDHIKDLNDLGKNFQKMVEHFYSHYKDWKKDWTGVDVHFNGWGDAAAAKKVIEESIERAEK